MSEAVGLIQNEKKPYSTFEEQSSTPTTPASGHVRIYADTSGDMQIVDDAGATEALGGAAAAITAHEADTSSAHTAEGVDIVDAGGIITATNVEAALQEIQTALDVAEAAAVAALDDLTDVDTDKSKSPADGDVMTYDGSHWNAEASAGGGASALDDLTDVDTDKSKTPADGDVMTFDGTHWNAEAAAGGSGTSQWTIPLPLFSPFTGDGSAVVSLESQMVNNARLLLPDTQNTSVEWEVFLSAGTWRVIGLMQTSSNRGIFSWQLDDAEQATTDSYSGGQVQNVTIASSTFVVAADGTYTFKAKMATKHASSTGYYGALNDLWLERTA